MFHNMRNSTKNGTLLENTALEILGQHLSPQWILEISSDKSINKKLIIKAPNGNQIDFDFISRKNISPKDIHHLLSRNDKNVLLVATFLSLRSCDLLTEYGASYVDTTGNLRLVANDPAIFIEVKSEKKDPQSHKRDLKSLKGAATARVIRALCDFEPSYGVRSLAKRASVPLGTTSRVVNFLEEEALLRRDAKKQIIYVNLPDLMIRWTQDYNILTSNKVFSYLEPRHLSTLISKLQKLDRYAVTGSIAGPSIAPSRLTMIYVDDAKNAAKILDLTPTDTGANVWLLEPYDEVVFERIQLIKLPSMLNESINAVAQSQLIADLMTSPGRGPQEAEVFLEQMKK